jgi:N-methylhydantoinase B
MTPFSQTVLQVMWNRLLAVVEEQGQALIRAAFSPIVRECGDISAGIFDLKGRMLAQAVTGTPGHINTMAEAVKSLLARFPVQEMKPGDIYMTNDPWLASGRAGLLALPPAPRIWSISAAPAWGRKAPTSTTRGC